MAPGTGGALFGPAVHGWASVLSRPAARSGLRGLYLAGGATHPGAGLAMAAISGRLAAAAAMAERA
jgi:1-hydroxycarotenoid 3,4-desaturase